MFANDDAGNHAWKRKTPVSIVKQPIAREAPGSHENKRGEREREKTRYSIKMQGVEIA